MEVVDRERVTLDGLRGVGYAEGVVGRGRGLEIRVGGILGQSLA